MEVWKRLEDTEMNPCDTKVIADKVLEDFIDTCDNLDIRYCLVSGTCLGFYRDGGYILSDNDIDIWVDCDTVESECYTTLTRRLLELGFTSEHFYHFYRDNILVDTWARSRLPIGQRQQFTPAIFATLVDTFDTIVYNNRIYNLPHPVEEYLGYKFGKNWRIPEQW